LKADTVRGLAYHRQDRQMVIRAVEMTIWQRQGNWSMIPHSDRGSQGGFNRSSQHRIVEQILDTHSELQRVFSSRVFMAS
jgi:hypothetical protein